MDPSDERHIERFVRNPKELPAERRQDVKRLIEADPGARAYAEFLRGFYDRLKEEPPATSSERVDAFVEELFQETSEEPVVSLRPFRRRREPRPTVLAADTDGPGDERRFSVLTTLAAESEDVLVRIVEDRETGKGRLYVLDKSPKRRAHVIVSFPDLGLDLVADEEGRLAFDLPTDIDADQWAEARAVVRRPVVTQSVAPDERQAISLPSGEALRARREDDRLKVAIGNGGPDRPAFVTASPPSGSVHLLRLDAPARQDCEVPSEAPLMLRVYE